jgi:hypothetical protein
VSSESVSLFSQFILSSIDKESAILAIEKYVNSYARTVVKHGKMTENARTKSQTVLWILSFAFQCTHGRAVGDAHFPSKLKR